MNIQWGMLLAFLCCGAASASTVQVEEYAPGDDPVRFDGATHIAFHGELEIVTDLGNDRFLYREGPDAPFQASPIEMDGPHSLLFNPDDGLYYANDTDNHRMIAFADLSRPELAAEADTMAGEALHRPHDQVRDPETGWLYAINPYTPSVIRFRAIGEEESRLDFSEYLGYSRALTLVDGVVYVVGSSAGTVIAIEDFDEPSYTVHVSHGKRDEMPAGNWEHTGLVLNDIAFHDGWWYASSYFTPAPPYSEQGQDYDRNKLIRFRTWEDFETGHWEDLSELLPSVIVPYYFTVHGDSLYLAALYHGDTKPEGERDVIYRLWEE